MPRPRKSRAKKPTPAPKYWYDELPGALWNGAKILGGAAATYYGGPLVGHLASKGIEYFQANKDYWDPRWYAQERYLDEPNPYYGPSLPVSIPDIDDLREWDWVPAGHPEPSRTGTVVRNGRRQPWPYLDQ